MKVIPIAAGIVLTALAPALADTPRLTVYAPDYFASEWGPGPAIKAGFEAECGCTLEYVTGDVLPRLLLEGARTNADVAIGLDTDLTARARASGLFAPHRQDNAALELPIDWVDDTFLPYDWSYVAFVYDNTRLPAPPTSFEALLDAPDDLRVVIQDPRSSISGLALLLWVKELYGDAAGAAWERLAPKIVTVTQGWTEAYGMFTDGEADMVLSFTTSPAYHIVAEDDHTKSAAIFDEGHYMMIELAGRIAHTDQPELADAFMAFILSDAFQTLIPEGNWSYPSAIAPEDWPQAFRDLPRPDHAFFHSEDVAEAMRAPALEEWRAALSR
ncbi:MAG: thiamine ABC transporter substrate binding subunit [Paracoccaceae bacterium]